MATDFLYVYAWVCSSGVKRDIVHDGLNAMCGMHDEMDFVDYSKWTHLLTLMLFQFNLSIYLPIIYLQKEPLSFWK